LERFYTIYVEKFANIDYLEYELDKYNFKELENKARDQEVINTIKETHKKAENEEIFNDDEDRQAKKVGGEKDPFNEMRETRTGFGAKVKKDYSPG
jgi:hypothetical protein